jgi:hypothetical protein
VFAQARTVVGATVASRRATVDTDYRPGAVVVHRRRDSGLEDGYQHRTGRILGPKQRIQLPSGLPVAALVLLVKPIVVPAQGFTE